MSGTLRYEIKAEAFRRMTGCMAPGKDPPPSEVMSYDERAAKFDQWLAQYGKCVEAVLKATEEFTEV